MTSEVTALAEAIAAGEAALTGVVVHPNPKRFVLQLKERLESVPVLVATGDAPPTEHEIAQQLASMEKPRAVIALPGAARANPALVDAVVALAAKFNVEGKPEVVSILCCCTNTESESLLARLEPLGLHELVYA